jgi:hypothetical protein
VVPVSSAVIKGGVKLGDSMLQHAVQPAVTEMSRAAARSVPWRTVAALGLVGLSGLAAVTVRRLLPTHRVVIAVSAASVPPASS